MSSEAFDVLRLEVKPSKAMRAWISAVHGLVFLVIVLAPAQRTMVAALLIAWIISLVIGVRLSLKRYTLIWQAPQAWRWMAERQTPRDVELLRYARWGGAAISLKFNHGLGWLMIFDDALSESQYRELQCRLFSSAEVDGVDL